MENKSRKPVNRLAPYLILIFFILYYTAYIYNSSFICVDGKRYFCLFDDAMISMRYAYNLSNGDGLVWNVNGERVEGFTNLLWTLYMAVVSLLFDKSDACQFVQLTGIIFIVASSLVCGKIYEYIFQKNYNELASLFIITSVLSCYPLVFWTLMGMEVGLLSMLLYLSILFTLKDDFKKFNHCLTISFIFMLLTRPDALIPVGVILLYRLWHSVKLNNKFVIYEMLAIGTVVLGVIVVRQIYYGEMFPNTYTLKVEGMPLEERIRNGIGYLIEDGFIKHISIIFLLSIIHISSEFSKEKFLLILLFLSGVFYQIWVGGDAFSYWRMLIPFVPLLFILCIEGIFFLSGHCMTLLKKSIKTAGFLYPGIPIVLCMLIIIYFNLPFRNDIISLRDTQIIGFTNKINVNRAIILNKYLKPDASIAVFYAGTIPYYTNFHAIDILGKSDKHVARLEPDLSGACAAKGMNSQPGHNKYDLNYSIIHKKPTYIENYSWKGQNIYDYASDNYYKYIIYNIPIPIFLRKDSPDVRWELLR